VTYSRYKPGTCIERYPVCFKRLQDDIQNPRLTLDNSSRCKTLSSVTTKVEGDAV
jgi:hypothetical protein